MMDGRAMWRRLVLARRETWLATAAYILLALLVVSPGAHDAIDPLHWR